MFVIDPLGADRGTLLSSQASQSEYLVAPVGISGAFVGLSPDFVLFRQLVPAVHLCELSAAIDSCIDSCPSPLDPGGHDQYTTHEPQIPTSRAVNKHL